MTQADINRTAVFSHYARIPEYFLLAGPFIALVGNAASDIWLSIIAVYFIFHSLNTNNWSWANQAWFKVALLFWLWIIVCSLLSEWPQNALMQAIPWIRFPLFAAALMCFLGQSERLWKNMLYAILLGVLLLAAILTVERLSNLDALRLYGTWSQNPKPGWYMLGLGLPVILWAFTKMKESSQSYLWALPLVVFLMSATIATGEVYITISMIFGCTLFVMLARFWAWRLFGLGLICFLSGLSVIMSNPKLYYRFTEEVLVRLPWRTTSDYYDPWIGGLNTGLLNPLLGIGVDNYEFFCTRLKDAGSLFATLGINKCFPHPHNIYIQVFTETGLIGLGLFIALAILLLMTTLYQDKSKPMLSTANIAALTIIIVAIWPISTYSQAFGQHKNMYTWLLIGWALATSAYISRKRFLPL